MSDMVFEIQDGDQFEFSGVEKPKRLGDAVYQVWFTSPEHKFAILRQLTKTGLVSKDESKQATLGYEFIQEYGRKLSEDEYVYEALPKTLVEVLKYLKTEHSESDGRKKQIVSILEEHKQQLAEKIQELLDQQTELEQTLTRFV